MNQITDSGLRSKKRFSGMIDFDFEKLLKDRELMINDFAEITDLAYDTARKMVRRGTVKPKTLQMIRRDLGLSVVKIKSYYK